MHNPPHPGELLGKEIGLKIAEAARRLGVSRVSLSRVVNCRASLTSELAYRLELAGCGMASSWLAMQNDYDLAVIRKGPQPAVKALHNEEEIK
ncbi:HigA family addiction module antitoxin [Aeromonas sp. Y311-2]|uniref:HigA family addiction module antitoxin n=1 Tax=Aeromonas sp. Y311-2 TaxID=2990507 RepID=UPI0022DF3141|nr:HigA family addiction module antitoxin [Aeromonas sp. Y311-2]